MAVAQTGSLAVARDHIFTLIDGTLVVHWEGHRVQELWTGQYHEFNRNTDFGRPITNHELAHLRASGRVKAFNQDYVWLNPIPDTGLFGRRRVQQHSDPPRKHTHHRAAPMNAIEMQTERLRQKPSMDNKDKLNFEEAHTSPETSLTRGKTVVIAISHDEERQAFAALFTGMELKVRYATTAAEVMPLLEDHPAHLLVTDMQLPDIHAWKLIQKVREIEALRELPIMVITDQASFGTTVARVDYLIRPVSIARLRQNVFNALAQKNIDNTSSA